MNKGLTTQEQIALAKEILQVKNRRERSLKLGEILDREKLSSDDMYEPTYVRIDKLSDLCIKEFMKVEQYVGKDNVRLPLALFNGLSDDLFDDVFECTLKRISFLIPNS